MFLANENFPRTSTLKLREKGFIVKSIQEDTPGISDREVMKIALDNNLIILTSDSDHGELIFKYSKDNRPSVVYFREKGNSPEFAASVLISLLENKTLNVSNAFTVVEVNRVRQRF
jgi:predicted nuclease of predicted toxin-antitoxin system